MASPMLGTRGLIAVLEGDRKPSGDVIFKLGLVLATQNVVNRLVVVTPVPSCYLRIC